MGKKIFVDNLSFKIEAGQVFLPTQAEWLDTLLLELLAFPQGKHDDQVDSISQFLKWATTRAMYDDIDIGGFISVECDNYERMRRW